MKRILFLIPTLMHGGAEKVLVNLVNNMNREKFKITVQTLFDVGVNKKYLKDHIDYRTNFRFLIPGATQVFRLFSPGVLYRLLIKGNYDVVVSYLEGPTARIVSGCNYKNAKLVSWIHIEQLNIKRAARSFLHANESKMCYERFDKIICVANSVKYDFVSIYNYKRPIEVLYNTIETEQILHLANEPVHDLVFDQNCFKICSVAKIVKTKGFDRLARIHKKLLQDGIKHHIYIFGIGEEKDAIETYLTENGLNSTFTFEGYKENPYKYIKNCDLYVCSSLREGFSTAVTESLVVGTPVVTTKCSGMAEMLGANSEYGLVTENNENSLYEGIKRMLTEPGLLTHYKNKAMERGLFFNTKGTVKAVEDMLEQL